MICIGNSTILYQPCSLKDWVCHSGFPWERRAAPLLSSCFAHSRLPDAERVCIYLLICSLELHIYICIYIYIYLYKVYGVFKPQSV